jgi:putative ABC transport system permease protein
VNRFRLYRTVQLGVRSLALHKLRSGLTVLGIIFGVSSVVAMLSIGEGANFEAQEEIKKLGSRNVIVRSAKPAEDQTSGMSRAEMLTYGITREDFRRLRDTLPTLRTLVPMRIHAADALYGRQTMGVQLVGTTPDYLEIANLRLARPADGRFVCTNDIATLRNVAVLGAYVAKNLFPAQDPIGTVVKVGPNYFEVVGILEETGAASGTGGAAAEDRNRNVYVPLTSVEKLYGDIFAREVSGSRIVEKVELTQLILAVGTEAEVAPTASAVRGLLGRSHPREDFEVVVPLELLLQREKTKRIFNVVLGSIAAISLLVGGIGIMNIMLASITERTREIGIRRALGAKRRDIALQFLVETVVLSTAGGLLGILLGVAVPHVVESTSGMKTIITPWSLAVSFTISAGVGVVFGLYPATRAASMDPIQALRHE